jgi:type IV secretion system protein TrbJ
MIRIRTLFTIASLALALTIGRSAAQMVVYDPSNYGQTLLVAAHTLQQVNNQLTALQNQTQMLLNQARHLTSLPTSLVNAIDQTFTQTEAILRTVDRIAYNVQAIGQAFSNYQNFNASQSDQELLALAQARWQTSLDAFQHSLNVGATTVGNLSATQTQTGTLIGASQSAVGMLQATQAGNQLLGLQARQMSDLTALVAAQSRAQSLEMAREAAAEDQAREQISRFLNNGQTYQPQTVEMFH